jgi:hypothetical protein
MSTSERQFGGPNRAKFSRTLEIYPPYESYAPGVTTSVARLDGAGRCAPGTRASFRVRITGRFSSFPYVLRVEGELCRRSGRRVGALPCSYA